MQGTWVQSLVRELRSHMPQAIKKEKKEFSYILSPIPVSFLVVTDSFKYIIK